MLPLPAQFLRLPALFCLPKARSQARGSINTPFDRRLHTLTTLVVNNYFKGP